ncbi:MAG: hypothetical protein KBT20_06820 [Bacteroidales bacterium]|nr:hypothetical protein [Candidatus Liminaster caballi]
MLKVLFARHRNVYFKLAFKYWVWPTRVYALAHGASAHSSKDSEIMHDLLDRHIVHRHDSHHEHYSHNPDDYEM